VDLLDGRIGIGDIADILVVAALGWSGLIWLRRTRARLALPALAAVGLLFLVARAGGLELTADILRGFFAAFVIVLVVIFQDDLRRLFEQLSTWGLRRQAPTPSTAVADTVARTAGQLAAARTGALLVFPGREPLERHLEGGIELGGRVSEPLLLSLFDASSPGHDGAVLIEGDRVARFAVHLPLSADHAQLGSGGTRHAAGLGIAELTDALAVIVSEERGTISVARDGRLRVLPDAVALGAELRDFHDTMQPAEPAVSRGKALRRHWREGLLALAGSALLWLAMVPGSGLVETERPARIVVENLPPGWELESVDPPEVEVGISGRWRDVLFVGDDDLRVRIDAFLVQLGRRTFDLSLDRVDHPASIEVHSLEPGRVRLQVVERKPESPAPG
jgi:diadenylate cyclase